jgi:hypothetical protein
MLNELAIALSASSRTFYNIIVKYYNLFFHAAQVKVAAQAWRLDQFV